MTALLHPATQHANGIYTSDIQCTRAANSFEPCMFMRRRSSESERNLQQTGKRRRLFVKETQVTPKDVSAVLSQQYICVSSEISETLTQFIDKEAIIADDKEGWDIDCASECGSECSSDCGCEDLDGDCDFDLADVTNLTQSCRPSSVDDPTCKSPDLSLPNAVLEWKDKYAVGSPRQSLNFDTSKRRELYFLPPQSDEEECSSISHGDRSDSLDLDALYDALPSTRTREEACRISKRWNCSISDAIEMMVAVEEAQTVQTK